MKKLKFTEEQYGQENPGLLKLQTVEVHFKIR